MLDATKVKPAEAGEPLYPHPVAPAPGTLFEVAPGVYWLRMPLPFALEHINLWLLADGDGWVVVDCGFGSAVTRRLWRAIFAGYSGGRQVTRIVVTHFHPDHFGLAAWLANEWQAPVLMSGPEYASARGWHSGHDPYNLAAYLAMFECHGLRLANDAGLLPQETLYRRGVPDIPARVTPLRDDQVLHINGREWRVIAGYGHSPEHAALACAELDVLIAGDMMLPRISTNVSVHPHLPDADPLGQFLNSLTRYARLAAGTLVLPAHGLPFYGLRERVQRLSQHHAARLEELRRACEMPRTAAEVMPILFKRTLDTHQVFFAMGEALSHLNYLCGRGQLNRETGADGIYRFVRA